MYKVAVEITHTFQYTEKIEVEVEDADNDKDALAQARILARQESEPSSWEGELTDSTIESISITERPPEKEIYRCNHTIDMFEGNV